MLLLDCSVIQGYQMLLVHLWMFAIYPLLVALPEFYPPGNDIQILVRRFGHFLN
jgi:hypothetical protein